MIIKTVLGMSEVFSFPNNSLHVQVMYCIVGILIILSSASRSSDSLRWTYHVFELLCCANVVSSFEFSDKLSQGMVMFCLENSLSD